MRTATRDSHPRMPHSSLDARDLQARTGRPTTVLDLCDSTNRLGRQAALGWMSAGQWGAALPLFVAEHQTAGRGRLDRRWESAPGQSLLFTLLLAPDLPLDRAPRAVLCWAAAMAEVLDVGLKWPNDLVDDQDRKLGGILAEHEPGPRPERVGILILGVGINVSQPGFPDLPQATSLALLRGEAPDRQDLLARLVQAIDAVDLHAPDALDRWRARSRTLGRRVRVAGREGVATGLRDDGALLVDGQPVLAGDVAFVEGPTGAPRQPAG